ncbi:type II secretion system protein N [Aliikangiella coralliicola]|uniref:Type II secretion system protein N n=1 Tax=Aliikangiella coralliicola TaxID=2592383 RepID=A0A545U7P9_9GAMM|nr:type II secretion system protein N [Aliikangiella coralliicola]TQV85496.1 type II secretion system protein N [Aliikangiella coralliicola]
MKKKIFVLTGLFILFVFMQAPASLIENFLPQNNKVTVAGLSGSLWSGEIATVNTPELSLKNVEYSINPLALFLAKLSLNLDISDRDVDGSLNLKAGSNYQESIELSDVNLNISASTFEQFVSVRGVKLSGDVSSSDLDVILENKRPTNINGRASWRKAAVVFGGKTWNLGDFVVELSTDEAKKTIVGNLQKTKNELGLEGKVTLLPDGMLEFVGSISTKIDQSLYNTVALFNNGKPANDRLPIKFKQRVLR